MTTIYIGQQIQLPLPLSANGPKLMRIFSMNWCPQSKQKERSLSQLLKSSLATSVAITNTTSLAKSNDAHTFTFQTSAISQLTEQVSQIKMENKQHLTCFDCLDPRWRPSWCNHVPLLDAMPEATVVNLWPVTMMSWHSRRLSEVHSPRVCSFRNYPGLTLLVLLQMKKLTAKVVMTIRCII